MLFGAGSSGKIHLWNMAKLSLMQDLWHLEQPANVSSDNAVAMSSNGDLLLVAKNAKMGKGSLELWDTARRTRIEPFVDDPNDVTRIATSSRNQLLTLNSTGEVRLWDLETKSDLGRLQLPSGAIVTSLVFSPDGNWAAIGEDSGWVNVYQMSPSIVQPTLRIRKHDDMVSSLAISQDNNLVASIDRHGKLRIWQREDGSLLKERDLARKAWISKKLEFSPNPSDSTIAILWGGVQVWNWENEEESYTLPHTGYYQSSITFSADAKYLITSAAEGTLRFWDLQLRRERIRFKKHRHAITHLTSSHDRNVLATVGRHGTIRIWRIPDPSQIALDDSSK
jgi:WD40 repeat protein